MSKPICYVLDDYQQVAAKYGDWNALGERLDVRFLHEHIADRDQLIETVGDASVVVAMRERTAIDAHLINSLKQLKLIVTTGMRNASIDIQAATDRGILVCGTESSSRPPFELTWALILSAARSIVDENLNFRQGGKWQSTVGVDLYGKTLGIVGLGKIGALVAKVATAFGIRVVAWSPHLTEEQANACGATLFPKNELFETSDFVTLHLVLSDSTRQIVGRNELSRMKATAMLVNTSRSGLVDSAALREALENSWISRYAVDVFDEEPLSTTDYMRSCPRVLATPHLGYVSEGNYGKYFMQACEGISAFLNGNPIRRLN